MSNDINVTDGTMLEALNNKVDLDGGNYVGSQLEAYIHDHCGSGFNIFDTKLSDHILEGKEAKGWALQGTYVYKEGVSGVRDGYPDFYNKVVEYYNNAETKTEYLSSNVTKIGALIDKQGVLSKFRALEPISYATLPQPFNPNSETWEMVFKFNFTDLSAVNTIFNTSVQYDGMVIRITTAGKLETYISSNGTSWNLASAKVGSFVFEANKDYWVKGIFDGTQYVFSYSTNGIDFITDITIASTTALYSTATEYRLGRNHDTNYLRGSIDLNESYINIGGSRWWTGCNYYAYKQSPNGLKFYEISEKSNVDEAFNATGLAWLYGVDTENERVFLPRNVWFDQLEADVSLVGDFVNAGLPNIYGSVARMGAAPTGCFIDLGDNANGFSDYNNRNIGFDAEAYNPIYGNSDTVQPNAVKKLLYICVGNTTTTSAVTDVIDVTTTENDTVPLFAPMYFDFTPNNLSWLKAGEQANIGGIYTTAYNELVNCLNGINKYNLKVIDTADMISGVDYSEYWKVNQYEMYFVTPTKLSYGALTNNIVSNGLAVTFSSVEAGNTPVENATIDMKNRGGANGTVGTSAVTGVTDSGTLGFGNQTGLVAEESTTAQLYFKVANAVQNLELLNVGEVLETVNEFNITKVNLDLSNCTKPYVIEVSDKSLLPSWYRVYSDGWCEQGGTTATGASQEITLLKPYLNADYTVALGQIGTKTGSGTTDKGSLVRGGLTTTGFTIYQYSSDTNTCWEAKGYIS